MTRKDQKKICDICGGTGQVSYFKGVSRFLLSTSECEECAGTGFQLDSASGKTENDMGEKGRKKGARKTRK
jgi:DnaJ-class molecular chaperone